MSLSVNEVKASTLDDSMVFYTTGSSFDNKAFSNSSSFSTINANTSHVASNMMLYFTTTEYIDYEILENGQQVFYMTLDICSTGNDVLYDIYNTYDNKIYYTQNTGKTCGFNGGYSGLIYRYYISLLVSGFDTIDTMDGYLIYFNRSIGLRNTASYNVFYRGLSVQIYNQSTFISALNDASGLDMSQQVVNNTQQIIDKTQEQINQNNTIINQNKETNEKLDGILNGDISNEDKELPDDSKYDEYENAESDLKENINKADLSNLSIGIDAKSSSWVWDTLTNLIQAHTLVFGMFIAILSIGVIKLALGR